MENEQDVFANYSSLKLIVTVPMSPAFHAELLASYVTVW